METDERVDGLHLRVFLVRLIEPHDARLVHVRVRRPGFSVADDLDRLARPAAVEVRAHVSLHVHAHVDDADSHRREEVAQIDAGRGVEADRVERERAVGDHRVQVAVVVRVGRVPRRTVAERSVANMQ